MNNLRIIADDLGLAECVNDGIISLLKNKKISGASLMPNGLAFEDAVRKLGQDHDFNIGIHIVLVEENSMVSGQYLPKNHKIFFIKYLFGLIDRAFIKKEMDTQVLKCLEAGIRPSFLNSHQHLHLLPGITDLVIEAAKKYNIGYIRLVNEPIGDLNHKMFRRLQLIFLNILSGLARKKILKAGILTNDFFVGFINAGNLGDRDINFAKELALKYPEKLIELGCHPGFENDDLRKKYSNWGSYNWKNESELLNR